MSDTQAGTSPVKVVTVTLNPSLDRMLTTRFLSIGYHNRTTETTRLEPAGRGVGISRALHALGIPTHAVILIGHDATGRAYQSLLTEEEYPITILRRSGLTRSNIHIVDTGHDNHTVIIEEGCGVTRLDRQTLANTLIKLVSPGDSVVFGGSLPGDVRTDTYAVLTSLIQTIGGAVAINAGGGEPLVKAVRARPRLVYLTQTQLEGMFNIPVRVSADVVYCASQLRARGVQRVLVAMEKPQSAILVTETGSWLANWPEVSGTMTGRAEAVVAGYLAGRLAGRPFDQSLGLAAAMAAYTVSQVGNVFGTFKDAEEYLVQVSLVPIDSTGEPLV